MPFSRTLYASRRPCWRRKYSPLISSSLKLGEILRLCSTMCPGSFHPINQRRNEPSSRAVSRGGGQYKKGPLPCRRGPLLERFMFTAYSACPVECEAYSSGVGQNDRTGVECSPREMPAPPAPLNRRLFNWGRSGRSYWGGSVVNLVRFAHNWKSGIMEWWNNGFLRSSRP